MSNNSKQAIIMTGSDGTKVFCCVECPMKYEDKELMEMHLCVHNSEYRFLCNLCGTGFKRKIHLDRHELEHLPMRPFICDLCERPFKRKEHLTSHHKKMHTGRYGPPKKYTDKMKMTIITRNEDGTCVFSCMQCPVMCDDKEAMALHLCSHNNNEYRYLCVLCGIGLKRKEHLERHMLEHQDVRPHSCVECGKSFKRKEHLTIHMTIHTNQRDQVCNYCGRSFHRKDHLQKHLQIHTKYMLKDKLTVPKLENEELEDEDDEMLVISEAPGKGLDVTAMLLEQGIEATRAMIQIPLDSRDPIRPYACPVCFKTYKRKDHLKIHSNTHLKTKPCAECGAMFQTEEQLLSHMNLHLNESTLLESQVEAVIDESCGSPDVEDPENPSESLLEPMAYAVDINDLKRLSERPHECPICFKRFKRRQHLKAHASVHERAQHRDMSIWCSICYQGFHTNDAFEGHECVEDSGLAANSENVNEEQIRFYPAPHLQQVDFTPIKIQQEEIPPSMDQDSAPRSPQQPAPQKLFECDVCTKQFRRKDHYKIHLNIHTGERPFLCQAAGCRRGFYRKDHLQKHAQVHEKKQRKKPLPELLPLHALSQKLKSLPEITIHAPSSQKLRLPLQMKVPYELVTSTESGEQRTIVDTPMKL